ncbi:MAG: glycosyltransferase [Nocardioidaceae bacterium]|nr:glycosyltransferase [Nocardioidaceae bacterium]
MPDRHCERVVAVVVTYNRRLLVERLLRALAAGTLVPDEVVVVDNASTDGTADALTKPGVPLPIHVIRLPRNTGGAGGFHTGVEVALQRGAAVIWLMDDDGLPDSDCLERLLPRLRDHDFVGPAVVAEDAPDRLCFPIRLPGGTRVLHRMDAVRSAAVNGLVADVLIPFNGVVLTRSLAERIGAPRAEFFIWGDDVEYLWRARRSGARVATVVGAVFRHPATDDLGTPMMFGLATYNHTDSDLKHYCMCRNNVVNLRDYRSWAHVLLFVAKTVWFYTLTRPRLTRLGLSARGVIAGLRNDFGGHLRYLQ